MDGKDSNAEYMRKALEDHLPRLHVSSNFTVLGPSAFPKPDQKAMRKYGTNNVVPILAPTHSKHRNDQDAVFLFAAEYALTTYLLFVESLRETGYAGDIVIAISKMDHGKPAIREYLESDDRTIVYVVEYTCFNAENEEVESAKGGMRICQCHNLYGKQKEDGTIEPLLDVRPPRTVPTSRYEIYWIWATHYSPHSWVMLIDARDTVFQTNPFENVPRHSPSPDQPKNANDGLLYFFAENQDATRIGLSKQNRKWLTNAYGDIVADILQNKPTICSGSTMGEQIALETYLRAMVTESDETGTKLMGADQGFHNFLYYSNKLANAKSIRSILVVDQGFGIINNLGALRTKELSEWGNGHIVDVNDNGAVVGVLNWDGTLSPVVHQFDRHKLLSDHFYKKKTRQYMQKWRASK